MSKNYYKRYNNSYFKSIDKYFGENGILYNFGKYFIIFNKDELNFCWIFISDDFNKFFSLSGKSNFQIFVGSIQINGIEFCYPFSENLYSPLSHAKITIERGKNSKIYSKLFEECLNNLINVNTFSENENKMLNSLSEIKSDIQSESKWTVLKLSTLNCVISDDIVQFKEFRRLFEVDTNFPFARKLKFSIIERNNSSYNSTKEISDSINEIITTTSTNEIISIAIIGSKDSGKSSLMKTMINKLFSKGFKEVFVIDGDPGQPEFTPNGCLSLSKISGPLFGPPFTHQYSSNIKILEQFFIGLISPADDPILYCRTFENLYHCFLSKSNNNNAPLIINTMGWTQGLGLSLIVFKLLLINPTFILQLKKDNSQKELIDLNINSINKLCIRVDILMNLPKVLTSNIHILKSPVLTQRNDYILKPIQHRELTMLAYLFKQTTNHSLCFPNSSLPSDYKENPVTRLRCRIPSLLNYSYNDNLNIKMNCTPRIKLKLIYSDIDQTVEHNLIPHCFSMQWVAICRPYNLHKYKSAILINPNANEIDPMYCIGMGLVTHVREQNAEIDLLTGVNSNKLDRSFLVKGKVFSPDCLILNQRELLFKSTITMLPYVSPMTNELTSFNKKKRYPNESKISKHNK